MSASPHRNTRRNRGTGCRFRRSVRSDCRRHHRCSLRQRNCHRPAAQHRRGHCRHRSRPRCCACGSARRSMQCRLRRSRCTRTQCSCHCRRNTLCCRRRFLNINRYITCDWYTVIVRPSSPIISYPSSTLIWRSGKRFLTLNCQKYKSISAYSSTILSSEESSSSIP